MSRTASDNQLRFWATLAAERQRTLGIPDVDAAVTALRERRITFDGIRLSIDELLSIPADPPLAGAPVRPAGPPPSDKQINFYVKLCHERAIDPTPEAFTKGTISAEIDRLLKLPKGGPVKTTGRWQDEVLKDVPNGYYAVPSVTGTNDLSFFRVFENQGRVHPEKKGQKLIKHVVGGHGEDLPVSKDWAKKAIAALYAEGVRASAELYGRSIGRCARCNTTLTDAVSRARGTGPECATKGW